MPKGIQFKLPKIQSNAIPKNKTKHKIQFKTLKETSIVIKVMQQSNTQMKTLSTVN